MSFEGVFITFYRVSIDAEFLTVGNELAIEVLDLIFKMVLPKFSFLNSFVGGGDLFPHSGQIKPANLL